MQKDEARVRTYKYFVVEGEGDIDNREPIADWVPYADNKYNDYVRKKDLEREKETGIKVTRHPYPLNNNVIKNGAEVTFWRKAIELLSDNSIIVAPTCGNRNMYYTVEHLASRPSTKQIILCPDWYPDTDSFKKLTNDINKCRNICRTRGIDFRLIRYYTFEWSLLSSTELNRMARCTLRRLPSDDCSMNRDGVYIHLFQLALRMIDEPSEWNRNVNRALLKLKKSSVTTIQINSAILLTTLLNKLEIKYKINAKVAGALSDYYTFEVLCSNSLKKLFTGTGFGATKGQLERCLCCDCTPYSCRLLAEYDSTNDVPVNIRCGLLSNDIDDGLPDKLTMPSQTEKFESLVLSSPVLLRCFKQLLQ